MKQRPATKRAAMSLSRGKQTVRPLTAPRASCSRSSLSRRRGAAPAGRHPPLLRAMAAKPRPVVGAACRAPPRAAVRQVHPPVDWRHHALMTRQRQRQRQCLRRWEEESRGMRASLWAGRLRYWASNATRRQMLLQARRRTPEKNHQDMTRGSTQTTGRKARRRAILRVAGFVQHLVVPRYPPHPQLR